jgi:chemotaxis protein histidine kinase CheA
MTEEQRMEEGRRMFQIFAARMFEQRVLTAYREKVSRERQQKLIEELEEESRVDAQREEKKAREAQKKKDKKKLQKQAKEEAQAKREAEKAAEEARVKAIEDKKQEEQRQRKEEQRKKKEAEKKAQEEERLKKEAEKQKRLQDERDRQAETERKQKEAKEREKKKRDDAKKKEREEREAKEKEARERKANEESERKAREEQIRKDREEKARKDRESTVKSEKEAKDRMSHAKREEIAAYQLAQTMATQKRPSQQMPVHLPPGLHPPQGPPNLQSPHFQVATPVVPKAPTPVRQRQSSQQGSHASSPRSQQAVTDSSHSASPLNAGLSQGSIPPTPASSKSQSSQPPLAHPQPSAPMSPIRQSGRTGSSGFSFDNMPPTSASMMPPGMPPRAPMGHDMPMYQNPPQIAPQYRNFLPNGMPPPGINGIRNMSQGRGFPMDNHANYPMHTPSSMAPSMPAAQNPTRDPTRSQPHSRQQSASYDKPVLESINTAPTQPIGRPAPIKRPSSTAPVEKTKENTRQIRSEMDELSTQLGSSALLDDTDVPLTSNMTDSMNATAHPGAPGSGRLGFGASPLFPDPMGCKLDPHPDLTYMLTNSPLQHPKLTITTLEATGDTGAPGIISCLLGLLD